MSNNLDHQRRAVEAVNQAARLGVELCNQNAMTHWSQMFLMDNQVNFWHAEEYDQSLERKVIDDFFKDCVGNFLVIGAANGIDQSFGLLERGWNVVYCEPDPIACQQLLSITEKWAHRVTIVNAAITPNDNKLTKFYVSKSTGLSSLLDPNKPGSREIITNAVSVTNLFKTIGYNFDYIQIDAEGLDIDLVKAMDWSQLTQCKMLCIEAGFPLILHLLEHGYVLTDYIGPYGYNTIYRKFQSIDSNKNLKKPNE